MAKKTNTEINGIEYYRLRVTIGRDREGKDIIKSFYGTSKRNAESKRDSWLRDNELGLDHISNKDSLARSMYKWVWEILKSSGIKASTFERYEGIYRNYFEKNSLAYTRLDDIQRIIIQKYYNTLFENGKTHSQIKNANKLLNMFFKYAMIEGYVLRNPCFGINLDSYREAEIEKELKFEDVFDDELADEGVIETFSDDEIVKLMSIKNRKLSILIRLALGTGLRQGELLALEQTDIKDMTVRVTKTLRVIKIFDSPKNYRYEFRITSPKTKKSRRKVTIPSELKKDLVELNKIRNKERLKLGEFYQENNLLFPSETGTYIDAKNLRTAWKRALNRLNISYKKFHSLRHTYATQLLKNGAQLITVSRLLGHSSIKTTEIYAHVLASTKEKDVEKLNSLFVSVP